MFKQRQPKQFNYTSRFNTNTSPEQTTNFKSEWRKSNSKPTRGTFISTVIKLAIALVAVLILMYILDGYKN